MSVKGDPIPIRFDPPEDTLIRKLSFETGLSMAEIIRRANRHSLPKFLNGSVDIRKLRPAKRPAVNRNGSGRKEAAHA